MRLSLKTKLVASFVAVITLTGAIATAVGVHFVREGIVREVQSRMALDLNSADVIFRGRLRRIQYTLELTALRQFTIRQGLRTNSLSLLRTGLRDAVRVGELDYAGVVDALGDIVVRAGDADAPSSDSLDRPLIAHVLRTGSALGAPTVLSASELARESAALAERARMRIVHTPEADPSDSESVTSGLVLEAAAPIVDASGTVLGAVYGGVLLNRNHGIVDAAKDTVYRGARYKDRDIGVATIFLGDVRISTNVMSSDGVRALGTRLAQPVYTRVLQRGKQWSARASVVGEWYFTAYGPLRDIDDTVIGALAVGVVEEKYADLQWTTFWSLGAVALGGMLLAAVAGYALAIAIVRPISNLRRGAASFAHGDWKHRVEVTSNDELGSLAQTFNTLAAELQVSYDKLHGRIESADVELSEAYAELSERQSQLIHAEKLASVGALAAGVAHEINNPLGTINMYAQMTLDELPSDLKGCRENLDVIVKHATRAGQIVQNLLAFARRSDLNREPISINALLNDVLAVTAHQAKLQRVTVTHDFDSHLPGVFGDADKFRQVLVNIIVNALQAMPDGGTLTVRTQAANGAEYIHIVVADTGHGIAQKVRERIFDPFFTTKETGKGTGLGLSVSQGIVEQHGGRILVNSRPGNGATFTIVLPAER